MDIMSVQQLWLCKSPDMQKDVMYEFTEGT